jgi:hypothetical protein
MGPYEIVYIDLASKEHWGKIYPYIDHIGMPAKMIADNYAEWICVDSHWSFGEYLNPETNVYYTFSTAPETRSETVSEDAKLQGNEICEVMSQTVGFFFPDAVWPRTDIVESQRFLDEYLGFRFEMDEWYDYDTVLFENRLIVSVNANAATPVVNPESTVSVTYLDDNQYASRIKYCEDRYWLCP